jgi:hypothetical protein
MKLNIYLQACIRSPVLQQPYYNCSRSPFYIRWLGDGERNAGRGIVHNR